MRAVEPRPAALSGEWRRFSAAAIGATLALFAALATFIAVSDPYDTGRFALFAPRPREAISPRLDIASRGRDPRFDGVIIGNSHIAPISPARLGEATGIAFASLIAAGNSVDAALALMRWFLAYRERPARAVVLGLDEVWCQEEPRFWREPPFPYWLIDPNPLTYLRGLIRLDSLEQAAERWLRPKRRHMRPRPADGFWDLELDQSAEPGRVRRALDAPSSALTNRSGRHPGVERLAGALAPPHVGREVPVVLVLPPVWAGRLERRSPELRRSDEACKAALAGLVASRPRTALVDGREPAPDLGRMENFFDQTHYRAPLASRIEAQIAATLSRLAAGGS